MPLNASSPWLLMTSPNAFLKRGRRPAIANAAAGLVHTVKNGWRERDISIYPPAGSPLQSVRRQQTAVLETAARDA